MEAVALSDFNAAENDELSCKGDDQLIITRANFERNWSKAVLYKSEGVVPKTFYRLKPIPGFMGAISRSSAEEMLTKIAKENSFLIRESQSNPGNFTISIWTNGTVKHAMISKDTDHKYRACDRRFSSINALIEHHRTKSIIRGSGADAAVILEHPVPESLIVEVAENFTARDKTELTVVTGDKVTITDYSDINWWTGNYKGKEGMLPTRFIMPVNYPIIFR